MVLNGNSSPTRLEKVSLLVTGATVILVFYLRVQQYFPQNLVKNFWIVILE